MALGWCHLADGAVDDTARSTNSDRSVGTRPDVRPAPRPPDNSITALPDQPVFLVELTTDTNIDSADVTLTAPDGLIVANKVDLTIARMTDPSAGPSQPLDLSTVTAGKWSTDFEMRFASKPVAPFHGDGTSRRHCSRVDGDATGHVP